jgi:AcrR family transcriptional regulator
MESGTEAHATNHDAVARSSLREESKDRARARIVEGALSAIASLGLDVTVDDVAAAAGVSRRTVFRQFSTHTDLMVAAVTQMLDELVAQVPAPPLPGTDVEGWLEATAIRVHEVLREIVGRAFWDVHVGRPGVAPEVMAALGDLAAFRRQITFNLAAAAWTALDAPGEPPEWVNEAFSMQLSNFATNVLASHSAQEAGRFSARILWAVLVDATGAAS